MIKSKILVINYSLALVIGLLIVSCAPKAESKTEIQFSASGSGPFFSGPNSLMADYTVNLGELNGLNDVSVDQLVEVKVNTVNVTLEQDMNFSAFQNATLQIVSAGNAMKTIAIKNPISSNTQNITLEVGEEVDLVDYFQDDKFSLVLDLDFKEDSYEEEIGTTIAVELSVKHN